MTDTKQDIVTRQLQARIKRLEAEKEKVKRDCHYQGFKNERLLNKLSQLEAEKVELVDILKRVDLKLCNYPIPWKLTDGIIKDIRAAISKAVPK